MEGNENNGTNQQNIPGKQEKTFTQEEVDNLIGRRLAKAMKGMPDAEELAAFRTWKNGQSNASENAGKMQEELERSKKELATAMAEVEQYKREKLLLDKGVPARDTDYYAFKIGKLVTDKKTFEQAADEYLNGNQGATGTVRVNMAAQLGGAGKAPTANDTMNALIRGARK